MRLTKALYIIVLLSIILMGAAVPTLAQEESSEIVIEIESARRESDPGTTTTLARQDVPEDMVGLTCRVTAVAQNNSSVHPGSNITIHTNGDSVSLSDVERESGATTPSEGTVRLGERVTVDFINGDRVTSFGGQIIVSDCERDEDDGGDNGDDDEEDDEPEWHGTGVCVYPSNPGIPEGIHSGTWETGGVLGGGGSYIEVQPHQIVFFFAEGHFNGGDGTNITMDTGHVFFIGVGFCYPVETAQESVEETEHVCIDCPPAQCLLTPGHYVQVHQHWVGLSEAGNAVVFATAEEAAASGLTFAGMECGLCSQYLVNTTDQTVYVAMGSNQYDIAVAINLAEGSPATNYLDRHWRQAGAALMRFRANFGVAQEYSYVEFS